jgi:predicted AAA+ superfamily ATPase
MNILNITISGSTATGKSTMMSLLEKLLLNEGFVVEMNFENELGDYGTEEKFRAFMAHNSERREAAIKEKSKVVIKTIQTAPSKDKPNFPLCSGMGEFSY